MIEAIFELCLFLILMFVCLQILIKLKIEQYFVNTPVWQIRLVYLIIAISFAYLTTKGIMLIYNATTNIFNSNN